MVARILYKKVPTMKLSAELFHHLSRSLSDQPSDHLSAENRGDPRARLLGRAVIIPCTERCERKPVSVGVRDLSPTGVGVIHDQRLDQGDQFILRVPGQKQSAPPALLCTVMHCRVIGPAVFCLGASFAGRIEPGQNASMERLDPASLDSITQVFRQQAALGLTEAEAAQLREVEMRLSLARSA
jgi:hypothetical protein